MADLPITEVVNVSVSAAQQGIGKYNVSNLALFTREVPGGGFGSLGYKIYLEPSEVATDFGSASATSDMATGAFSQQPNLLAGDGYLVVIPFDEDLYVAQIQHLAFSGVPASGAYRLQSPFDTSKTSPLAFDAAASAVQAALRLLVGLESVVVTGDYSAGFDIQMVGVVGSAPLITAPGGDNTLQTSAPAAVTITPSEDTPGEYETMEEAILRTEGLVQYFGIIPTEIMSEDDQMDAATFVQPLNKMLACVSRDPDDVANGGRLDLLRSGNLNKSRGLFYGSDNDRDALVMAASYFGRALGVNFTGSNTTITMHLKDLIGVQPDPSMTVTLLNLCKAAGADTYISIQGVPKVFCVGANDFFDQVYNLCWFVGDLIVNGFNALATTSTKVPQTEAGVAVLKGAYRESCEQGLTNQYLAPGRWTSPTTFGNLNDFLRNIEEKGYYIYSAPVALQSAVDRAARIAPLIQIAAKEAGAIHKSNVIVYINP